MQWMQFACGYERLSRWWEEQKQRLSYSHLHGDASFQLSVATNCNDATSERSALIFQLLYFIDNNDYCLHSESHLQPFDY
jgi:hypothetical protein